MQVRLEGYCVSLHRTSTTWSNGLLVLTEPSAPWQCACLAGGSQSLRMATLTSRMTWTRSINRYVISQQKVRLKARSLRDDAIPISFPDLLPWLVPTSMASEQWWARPVPLWSLALNNYYGSKIRANARDKRMLTRKWVKFIAQLLMIRDACPTDLLIQQKNHKKTRLKRMVVAADTCKWYLLTSYI